MGATGYRVQLGGSDELLKIGTTPYWQLDFQNVLLEVNRAKTVDEPLFPNLVADLGNARGTFVVMDGAGHEILRHSTSLAKAALPRSCLNALQAAIDQLHAWAEDPRVPPEKREFCRSFCLPDPQKDPNAYRMTGGPFSRKLHVLWGYEKKGSSAFLPKSKISETWEDAANRRNVGEMCRGSLIRRVFRLWNILLGLVLAALVEILFFLPVKCPLHGCVVGRGIRNSWGIEERCPKRCSVPTCGRHLNVNGVCMAHRCRKCGAAISLANGQKDVCDSCFLELE